MEGRVSSDERATVATARVVASAAAMGLGSPPPRLTHLLEVASLGIDHWVDVERVHHLECLAYDALGHGDDNRAILGGDHHVVAGGGELGIDIAPEDLGAKQGARTRQEARQGGSEKRRKAHELLCRGRGR